MANGAEKKRQRFLWDESGRETAQPRQPPLTGEPMLLGAAEEKKAGKTPSSQLSLWEPATGGITPSARHLVEEFTEFKDLGLTKIRDAQGKDYAMEWVLGLGRSRLALRITRNQSDYTDDSPSYTFTLRDYNTYPQVGEDEGGRMIVPASGRQGEIRATPIFSVNVKLLKGKDADPNTWDFNLTVPEGLKGIEEDEAELSRAAVRRISDFCNYKAGRIFRGLKRQPQLIAEYEEEERHGDARTDFLVKVVGFKEQERVKPRSGSEDDGDRVRLLWTPDIDREGHFKAKSEIRKPR